MNKLEKPAGDTDEYKKLLDEASVKEALSYMRKFTEIYAAPYMKHGAMEYESLVKFCRDFAIFPELCTKSQLHQIFYSLAFERSREENSQSSCSESSKRSFIEERKTDNKSTGKKEFIDSDSLVNALGICALRTNLFESEPSAVGKILRFADKIIQSKGVAKVKQMSGKTRYLSRIYA